MNNKREPNGNFSYPLGKFIRILEFFMNTSNHNELETCIAKRVLIVVLHSSTSKSALPSGLMRFLCMRKVAGSNTAGGIYFQFEFVALFPLLKAM